MRPAADELDAAPVARVTPRRVADELAAQIRDEVPATACRRVVVLGPPFDLDIEHLRREVGETSPKPRARDFGRADLLHAHVVVDPEVSPLELRRHVARLVYRAGALAQERPEPCGCGHGPDVPARGAAAACEE